MTTCPISGNHLKQINNQELSGFNNFKIYVDTLYVGFYFYRNVLTNDVLMYFSIFLFSPILDISTII